MKKRVLAIIMVLVMGILLLPDAGKAKAATGTKISVVNEDSTNFIIEPGTTKHVRVQIGVNSAYVSSPKIAVECEDDSPLTISNLKLLSESDYVVTYFSQYDKVYLEFDVTTEETAKIGQYPVDVNFTYVDYFLIDENGEATEVTDTISFMAGIITEKKPVLLTASDVKYTAANVVRGKKFDLSFLVKNEGDLDAYNIYCSLNYEGTGLAPAYTLNEIKLDDLARGKSTRVKVSVEVLPDAEFGKISIPVKLIYKDKFGAEGVADRTIYVTIPEEVVDDVKLRLSAVDLAAELEAGKKAEIQVKLENIGNNVVQNIKIKGTDGLGINTGILPDYSADGIVVASLASGKSTIVKLPVLLTEDVVPGLKAITVEATCLDDVKYERKEETILYVMVATIEEELVNEVVISNVSQNPKQPEAGKEIEVSFTISNKGNRDISNVRLAGSGLSSLGFEPLNSEPYQSVGTIAAGAAKNVTMKFKVGKEITAGLNMLSIICSYKDASENTHDDKTDIYILDVVNDSDSGRPKLIVSDFTTDQEILRAGTTFNYMFKLVNTHASKAAKNIKVTVTQPQNIFAPTSGGNSFYIQNIPAGESRDCSLELKVSHEASTSSYDLSILVEYEYDDMVKTDMEKGGASEENIVKLTATENARPEVQNIYMYDAFTYSEVPTVGNNVNMNFEFYNMGRSTLNNVYITIEGDFSLASGSMKYIGSVGSGGGEWIDCEVIPNVEGEALCSIVVHYEDSNGDEVTKTTEHSVYVQGMQTSPFPEDPSGDNWQGGDIEPVGPVVEPKEPIVQLWLFIVIQAVVLVLGFFVTRGIIIGVHKSKLRKKAETEN